MAIPSTQMEQIKNLALAAQKAQEFAKNVRALSLRDPRFSDISQNADGLAKYLKDLAVKNMQTSVTPTTDWVDEDGLHSVDSLLVDAFRPALTTVESSADQEESHSVDPQTIKDAASRRADDHRTVLQRQADRDRRESELGRDWARKHNPHYKR